MLAYAMNSEEGEERKLRHCIDHSELFSPTGLSSSLLVTGSSLDGRDVDGNKAGMDTGTDS